MFEQMLKIKGTKSLTIIDCQAFCSFYFAEREGFEPPEPFSSTVFKTAGLNRSPIFPICGCKGNYFFETSIFSYYFIKGIFRTHLNSSLFYINPSNVVQNRIIKNRNL